MSIATVDDVQDRYGQVLSEEERRLAKVLLQDVEAILRGRLPDLEQHATDDVHFRARVVMVEANSVLRVLRNPEGYRQEVEGNYSYSISAAVASGHLFVMDSEWGLLGGRGGAFTITPVVRDAWCRPDPWTPGECW